MRRTHSHQTSPISHSNTVVVTNPAPTQPTVMVSNPIPVPIHTHGATVPHYPHGYNPNGFHYHSPYHAHQHAHQPSSSQTHTHGHELG